MEDTVYKIVAILPALAELRPLSDVSFFVAAVVILVVAILLSIAVLKPLFRL